MAKAFVTVTLDSNGEIQKVRRGTRSVKRRKGKAARKELGPGAKVVKRVKLEMLVHKKQTKKRGSGKGKGKGRGTDPCCFRDPRTGYVWCWC